MNILFTICGRAGSKGFKNKNLKEMNGIPLVYYTLAVIKGFTDKHKEDKVFIAVNTDSEPLMTLVKAQSQLSAISVERKLELAGDVVAKVAVIKDTYLECKNLNPDIVMDLDITSPLRTIQDIEKIIEEYKKGKFDLVFSVVEARRSPYFNMVEKKEDGYYRKICASQYTARQQAPQSYEMNASIYAYNPKFLNGEMEKTILEYNCGVSIMTDYLVLDIDSEEDFQMMEFLHQYYCETNEALREVRELAQRFI